MPDESEGRWAIVQTVGDYREHTSIRCFFQSEDAAWEWMDKHSPGRAEVRFIGYGQVFSF